MSEMRAFLRSERSQQTFIKQAVDLIVKRRADGANLDFEPMPESLSKDFTSFVARFRTALRKRQPRSTLVVALEAAPPTSLIKNIVPHVDDIFIMAYDYRTKRSGQAGAVAPLDGRWTSVRKHLDRYLRYAPASKLILGVPYYGYDWPVVKQQANADVRRGRKYGSPFAVTYASIHEYLDRNPETQIKRDPISKTPYFTYRDADRGTYRQVWYEDTHSLKAKYTLAVDKKLAGVGIWALDNDRGRPELWTVLRKTFGSGHNPVLRGSVFHLAARNGKVTADVNLVLINRGSIPERGRVDWVIRNASGGIITKGHTTMSASAGRRAQTVRHITLGLARRLRAGTATFQMTYTVDGRKWKSPVVKFKQPY
jgi:GH18 family chitinase